MATTIYEAIRSSLIALLKGRWPAFDVFGEGIDKTQEEGQTELEDYIYLDIIPSGNQSAGRGYTPRARAIWSTCRSARRWTICCAQYSALPTKARPGR